MTLFPIYRPYLCSTMLVYVCHTVQHGTTLRQLTTQARYSDMVREGHWIWVYDNLNMHQRVRHERTGELVQGTSTHTGIIMIMPKMCTIIHVHVHVCI